MNPDRTVFGPQPYRFVSNYPSCTTCGKEDQMMSLEWCGICYTAKYCTKACRRRHLDQHPQNCTKRNYVITVTQKKPNPLSSERKTLTLSVPGYASFEDLDSALKIGLNFGVATGNKQVEKHYGFLVLNEHEFESAAWKQTLAAHMAYQAERAHQPVLHLGPETLMHTSTVKLCMVEAENWNEMQTPKARAFAKLPWCRSFFCMNSLPSEMRAVGRIMEDDRFRNCALEYHYDFDAGTVYSIACIGKANPTNAVACLSGTGAGFDREEINRGLVKLPVGGEKQTLAAGYGQF